MPDIRRVTSIQMLGVTMANHFVRWRAHPRRHPQERAVAACHETAALPRHERRLVEARLQGHRPRRRSGAPSKVYQWLGPRCRQKVTRKNFANRPPLIFTGGGVKKCEIWPRFSKSVAFEGL